jgi:hypothetical protein
MSRKLLNLNSDLRKLVEEGYNVDIVEGYLVVRDIPYVNVNKSVLLGTLVMALDLNGDLTNPPSDHTSKFIGEYPCDSNGKPLDGIRHSSGSFPLGKLTANHNFSSKPTKGSFDDFYEKVSTYCAIIAGHANVLYPGISPKTFRVAEPTEDDSPFHYIDTASARAEISEVTRKLAVDKVAIVGIGGTGSYVLDLLSKTPVREIHLFDGDKFSSHNAYRAPGAASKQELHNQMLKVEYFAEIYSKMRRGIVPHGEYISESNIAELHGMDCIFLCMDTSREKAIIVTRIEAMGSPFIDTGMGLYETSQSIGGILRVTLSDAATRGQAKERMSFATGGDDGEYDRNIQIADLNALNATLAVIKWKKMHGFYLDQKREHCSTYTIGRNMLLSEDCESM